MLRMFYAAIIAVNYHVHQKSIQTVIKIISSAEYYPTCGILLPHSVASWTPNGGGVWSSQNTFSCTRVYEVTIVQRGWAVL